MPSFGTARGRRGLLDKDEVEKVHLVFDSDAILDDGGAEGKLCRERSCR